MNTTDKLKLLINACKCCVHITVNAHRGLYQSATQLLAEIDGDECPPELEPQVRELMIATNTIIEIRFYPTTPIGFYAVFHYDIDAALDEAIDCLRQEGLIS